MKRLITYLLFSALEYPISAQNPLPTYTDNPLWNVVDFSGFGGSCSVFSYSLGPVTTIGSNIYYPVYERGASWHLTGYYRTTGSKIYFRYFLGTPQAEHLEYDFGLNVGDTVVSGYNFGDSTKFWVKSKASVIYEGISRTTFTMNYYYFNGGPVLQTTWMEGIGSYCHAFPSLACLEPQCDNLQQLMKLTVNGSVTYLDTVMTFPYQCSSWVGLKENSENPEIKIYPSVSHNEINIETDCEGEFKISNVAGQQVISGFMRDGNNKINVYSLNAGLYFFTFKSGNFFYRARFIKE